MCNARTRALVSALVVLCCVASCRRARVPTEALPHRVKDVSYRELPVGETIILGPTREIMVPDVRKDTPLIDGILNDPCWRQSAKATDFVLRRTDIAQVAKTLDPAAEPKDYPSLLGMKFDDDGDCLAMEQTEVRLCHGTSALYVAFDCRDSQIVAKTNRTDGPVLEQDDCVELVINTHRNVFHIAVNPRGACYTSRVVTAGDTPTGPDRWHPSITTVMGKSDKTWQCEMAIPFQSLEIKSPSEGSFLGVNIGRRNRPPVKHDRYEIEEVSTWSAAGRNILEPRSEGIMFFRQGPPALISFLDPGRPGFGYNRAVVGVRSRASAESTVRVRLITFGPEGEIIESASQDLALPPKEEKITTLTYKVPYDCKTCSLNAALFTMSPETLIGHQDAEIKVPAQLLLLELDKSEYAKGAPIAWGKLDIGVGGLRLGAFRVILALRDAKGELSRDELSKLQSPLVDFSLSIANLKPGRYTLSAELREGDKSRGETSRTFDIKR